MQKVKTIFSQTLMISTAILFWNWNADASTAFFFRSADIQFSMG